MRIQHNILAMNAYRNYNTNTSALGKNLEKLSSGYKINRAGDDAAGLAISEKMRAQITGLNAAQKNVKDGISLVKTAEGAMQEIQDMLNRMDYLATQSANGTYQNEVDRENLQKEVNQLLDEIDRIADSSNFNGIKLLDGSLDPNAQVGAADKPVAETSELTTRTESTDPVKATFKVSLEGAQFAGTAGATQAQVTVSLGGTEFAITVCSGGTTGQAFEIKAGAGTLGAVGTMTVAIQGVAYTVTVEDGGTSLKFEATTSNYSSTTTAASLNVSGFKLEIKSEDRMGAAKDHADAPWSQKVHAATDGVKQAPGVEAHASFTLTKEMIESGTLSIGAQSYNFSTTTNYEDSASNTIGIQDLDLSKAEDIEKVADAISRVTNADYTVTTADDGKLNFQAKVATAVTASVDYSGKELTEEGWSKGVVTWGEAKASSAGKALQLQIGDTSDPFNQLQVVVGDMHRGALGLQGLDISTASNASAAIQKIKDAINTVSSVRGDLGATQNRLEHTQNNLSVMAENIQDAESTIRDTDVAEEMMSYVKNNILVQSAQAMLAQANQVPQGVLQLLG